MRALPARKETERALHTQVQTAAPPRLWRFLAGVAALLLALLAQRALNQRIMLDTALLGGGALILWLRAFGPARRPARQFIGDVTSWWARWPLGLGGLVAAVGLAVWRWRVLDVNSATTADWLWYVGGIGLAVAAAGVMGEGNRKEHKGREGQKKAVAWNSPLWLVGTLLLGGALLVRLYGLEQIPFGTWYDEAANGLEALRVVREPAYRPIYTDGVNATGHYLWLIAGAFKLFGVNTTALRLISALMGAATVIAAYGVGKELYGRTAGVAAALFFAAGHWALTFSRLGMYNASTPLLALATLYFVLVGLRRNSPLAYALAGVSLGLGLCFYSAFQLYVAVLMLFVGWIVWRERARWRNFAPGLALMVICAGIVIAPVAKFALEKPDLYFARVRYTSIFTGKTAEEWLPAVLENTRKHLLMFNVAGDPNGRHNLPGAPTVDTVTGGLLILGTALALRRLERPEMALLPVWLLAGLAGGIFSLDFEAPQSLRSIGAQPAVYLLAALPLQELAGEWISGAGRYYPAVAWWLVGAVLAPVALLNVHTYFYRQTHDFPSWNNHSTPETITARLLGGLGEGVQPYVISLYDQHPTVRFLASGIHYRRLETNATLPLLEPATQDAVLILDGERRELFTEAKRLYPQGEFEEIKPPFGGPTILYIAHLGLDDLTSIQGLNVTYSDESGAVQKGRDETINVLWPDGAPLPLPFTAEWEGILAVSVYGLHELYLQAPGQAELMIDGETVASGDAGQGGGLAAGVVLARGNHTLRLRAEGGRGQVTLAWRTPEHAAGLAGAEVTPSWALYVPPVRANGLLGQYYANGDWQPPVTFAQVDPRLGMYFHVPLLPRPYTVEWIGKLAVPESGRYGFALESIDESVLIIDGIEVAASRVRNEFSQGEIELNEGLHDIRVRYADRTDHTYINLYWRPPAATGIAGYQLIPPDFLFPPRADYDQIEIPPLASFVAPDARPATLPGDAAPSAPATVEIVLDGLNLPRGVAVLGETVYVAESGAARVLAVPVDGGEPWPIADGEAGAPSFVEPFDLAADAAGNLVVLDAGAPSLSVYTPDGDFVAQIPAGPALLERARGIGVDEVGRIWIASTPSQRVAAVDPAGAVVAEVARQLAPSAGNNASKEMQPVDVVGVAPDQLYVTDSGNHRLYQFALGRGLLAATELPVANSLDGPHLAADARGKVYMTAPEPGQVVEVGAPAEPARVYSVRTPAMPQAKPVGIAVDSRGHIWVTDVQGGRLLRLIPGEQ